MIVPRIVSCFRITVSFSLARYMIYHTKRTRKKINKTNLCSWVKKKKRGRRATKVEAKIGAKPKRYWLFTTIRAGHVKNRHRYISHRNFLQQNTRKIINLLKS